MVLEVNDEQGNAIPDQINVSLTNLTYDRLPTIAASGAQTLNQYATIDHAATCYSVDLDNNQLPHFDSRGITLNEDRCVASTLTSYVVFIDDLPKEIEEYEMFSQGA